jgi:hypothetical protein
MAGEGRERPPERERERFKGVQQRGKRNFPRAIWRSVRVYFAATFRALKMDTPAIETLEKIARALECPLYQLFYEGEEPPKLPNPP